MSRRVVIAAALASVDRRTLASLLAWPVFDELRKVGKLSAPAIPIYEGPIHG